MKTAENVGYNVRLLRAIEQVNESQKSVLTAKVKEWFGEIL